MSKVLSSVSTLGCASLRLSSLKIEIRNENEVQQIDTIDERIINPISMPRNENILKREYYKGFYIEFKKRSTNRHTMFFLKKKTFHYYRNRPTTRCMVIDKHALLISCSYMVVVCLAFVNKLHKFKLLLLLLHFQMLFKTAVVRKVNFTQEGRKIKSVYSTT